MANNESYYLNLSLPPLPTKPSDETLELEKTFLSAIEQIENEQDREKIRAVFQKVVVFYNDKYEMFRHALQDVEQSKKQLQCRLDMQSQQFDRSLREMQHYKHLYETTKRQRSALVSSNASCVSGKSYASSSARSSSCASYYSYTEEVIDPVMLDRHLSESESTLEHNENDSFATPSEEILTFACGDGFWNTIAHGKSNKAEVDTLISNYLRRGGNPNVAKNSDTVKNVKEGYGLIHALIAIRNTPALQKVISAGIKTNVFPLTSKRQDRITPVVLAAKLGYMNGIRLLVERGNGDLFMSRGPYGENALHAAVQSDSEEMVAYILTQCKNKLLELPDSNGATPLHYACTTGKTKLITLFVRDCHAQPDPKDVKGETPLHYAVRNRKLKAVAKLVGDLGVYPNPYVYKQVPTPLDLAKAGGLKTIADYLKREGAKTTKELEKASRSNSVDASSSNNSILSRNSSASGDSGSHQYTGVRQYLHTKTSQILKGTF